MYPKIKGYLEVILCTVMVVVYMWKLQYLMTQ